MKFVDQFINVGEVTFIMYYCFIGVKNTHLITFVRCKHQNAFTLYPWVHQFCNNMSSADQTHAINFPDINPSDMPPGANFSMAAGDFLEIYTEPGTYRF